MRIPIYQVDAFADELFKGNPAAVCLLDHWLEDEVMQDIAQENNLSETAFCVVGEELCELRWFTPETEIDLCGHATLATAYVIFSEIGTKRQKLIFQTQSGNLEVTRDGELLTMRFSIREGIGVEIPPELVEGLGHQPMCVLQSRDLIVVYEKEETIRNMKPNMDILKKIDAFGIVVTAKGDEVDFVSRYFAPASGVAEDPVTGSSHCTLVPYWEKVLGKEKFVAKQLSPRGGTLYVERAGNCVAISGSARLFLKGEIYIP